ncbi:DUF84 family protein [Anaerobacillus sp. MEB173]|uniref:DUF84 family protein n=1 Tax=Anaerobacillus sp. MEB173 TaxID=3383345 RepID=UPI003F8F04AC
MWKVAIGSKNQAKINAVKAALRSKDVNVDAFDIPSAVSKQPFSDEETQVGAINRAKGCLTKGEFDFAIGLEGGVVELGSTMFLCNWGALVTSTEDVYVASGAKIALPEEVAAKVREGVELGIVMADFTGVNDIRKKEGAIGIFTNGYVSRAEMFTHVVKLLIGQYEYKQSSKKN